MALSPGNWLGPHEIVAPLGAGGMGEVYLARDSRLGRDVAIKELPDALAADPERLARFEREAKVLASLNHAGVGAIYGLEEASGHRYLVLEYVQGETLASRSKRGAIPLEEALPLAKQIAEALETAHEKGIVHRDLKPANIMVTDEGRAKVLGFGLARSAESVSFDPDSPTVASPAQSPTIAGVIMGTAGHGAGPQLQSLGVTLRRSMIIRCEYDVVEDRTRKVRHNPIFNSDRMDPGRGLSNRPRDKRLPVFASMPWLDNEQTEPEVVTHNVVILAPPIDRPGRVSGRELGQDPEPIDVWQDARRGHEKSVPRGERD